MISEIGYREARELLRDQNTGRLGCCSESMPYVIPVNYFFDGEDIYIHSMPGRKIQIMRANPHVCLPGACFRLEKRALICVVPSFCGLLEALARSPCASLVKSTRTDASAPRLRSATPSIGASYGLGDSDGASVCDCSAAGVRSASPQPASDTISKPLGTALLNAAGVSMPIAGSPASGESTSMNLESDVCAFSEPNPSETLTEPSSDANEVGSKTTTTSLSAGYSISVRALA